MLLARQSFPLPHDQESGVLSNGGDDSSINPASGSAPGEVWHDEQEQFLRNLLGSTPLEHDPPSVSSATTHFTQTPPYIPQQGSYSSGDEAGRTSSLSPVSSAGYQSLHEFIHQGNVGSLAMSASSNGGQPTPTDVEAPLSGAVKIEAQPVDAFFSDTMGQGQAPLDPGTIDFFVNMMTQDPNAVRHPVSMADSMYAMMQQNAPNGQAMLPPQMNLAMLHQQAQQMQHAQHPHHMAHHPHARQYVEENQGQAQMFTPQNQHFTFQNPMLGRSSLPFTSQQQHMTNLLPALDSRKRSAPASSESAFDGRNASQGDMAAKRSRKPSGAGVSERVGSTSQNLYGGMTSSILPHMEVGSNATALAAIERLKAKKLAAAELESKARASKAEQIGKAHRQGNGTNGSSLAGPHAHKQEKKVAHNAIERRYRNNINARIAALRNTVPALRELRPKKPTRKGKQAPPEDLVDGVPAATKLNKATILGKATEYIRYLKGRETRLVSEVAGLRELIRRLEGGEELLELWQGEMERAVAEQEALMKAQLLAYEDEGLDMGDEEDDDDEEEEEDELEGKPSHSPSTNASSSSRYMMGIFMGFSVLGGGAEIIGGDHATSSSATEHAHSVLRASSGRVIGASHQLLKRGLQATNVSLGSMAEDPHHYDHVANHLLIVEVLRGLALVACLAFIFWPWIARLPYFSTAKDGRSGGKSGSFTAATTEEELDLALRRKEMVATLNNPTSSPHQVDRAMRHFVGAPMGAIGGVVGLTTLICRESARRVGLSSHRGVAHEEERLAIWCRLLELETSMGPLAQRSLLARLHTILAVMSSPSIGLSSRPNAPILHPSRVFGTLAIAMSRASNGIAVFHSFAQRFWTKARRCRLLATDETADMIGSTSISSDRWLDPVLELDLLAAITLCPAPTNVASTFSPQIESTTRTTMTSPLLSVASSQHAHRLAGIWSTLLCQIVQTTCPSPLDEGEDADKGSALSCSDFLKHYSEAHLKLPLASDAAGRDHLTSEITHLTLTAPQCPRTQILCNVTLGAWALLIGNASVARSVAVAIVRASHQGNICMPASAVELVSMVLGQHEAQAITGRAGFKSARLDEVDALAAAALAWIGFLRLLSQQLDMPPKDQDVELIASSAVSIRRLLAAARAVRPAAIDDILADLTVSLSSDRLLAHRDSLASTASSSLSFSAGEDENLSNAASRLAQSNLDDALDTLTDILTVLGRRAASGGKFSKETFLEKPDDQIDSGVEWVPASA